MKVFGQLEKAQLENTISDTGLMPKGMLTYRTDLNQAKISNGTIYKFVIDEDSVQILANKTLTTPAMTSPVITGGASIAGGATITGGASIAGALTLNENATPAAPAAGFHKLYFKADGNVYFLNSAGSETTISGANTTVQAKTANYTLLTSDFAVKGNASGGAFTLTLPTAVGNQGLTLTVSRTDQTLANIITLNTTSSQTIGNYGTSVTLATQDETWVVYSDGANWQVRNHSYPSVTYAFTGLPTGFGVAAVEGGAWWRTGKFLNFVVVHTTNANNGATLAIPLPAGLAIDSSSNTLDTAAANTNICGQLFNLGAGGSIPGNGGPYTLFMDTSVALTAVYVANGTSGARFNKATGSAIIENGGRMSTIAYCIPITNWTV